MKNLKITKKELVNLCLNSDYSFQTVICHPEKCSQKSWDEIENVLNYKLSKAVIERNLFLDVEEAFSFLGCKNIEEIIEDKECLELEAIEMVKSFLVCETLNNAYFEVLYKKCHVPESLSLGITVEWLATDENIKAWNEIKQAKIKHDNRPSFTKEMMINFINNNREMVKSSFIELNELKKAENKQDWQKGANALVQKVSNNDFRVLKWKGIYNLIKQEINN